MTPTTETTTLEDLLTFIKVTRGFDFTGYKRSSLERRIGKRMSYIGIGSYDEEALDQARAALYAPKAVEGLPTGALDEFFERVDQRYAFRKDLRRSVIFGRNDLVQDAPISRIDFLVCRNTLMYFNAETQERILRRFHFALDPDGVLLLGKSEMLLSHSNLFTPIDLKRRVFRKVGRPTLRDRVQVMAHDMSASPESADFALRTSAFDLSPTAQ